MNKTCSRKLYIKETYDSIEKTFKNPYNIDLSVSLSLIISSCCSNRTVNDYNTNKKINNAYDFIISLSLTSNQSLSGIFVPDSE